MRTKVYLVEGSCGELCDTYHWIFRAFLDKETAETVCYCLNKKLKDLNMSSECRQPQYDFTKVLEIKRQIMLTIDANFSYDYTGTMYEVKEVDLEE